MTTRQTFPDDENGDVLRRMQSNGDDLSKPRDIEFTVVLPTFEAADRFMRSFRNQALVVEAEESGCVAELPWDVRITKHMLPEHADITAFENELEAVVTPLGGRNDGWGCFEQ